MTDTLFWIGGFLIYFSLEYFFARKHGSFTFSSWKKALTYRDYSLFAAFGVYWIAKIVQSVQQPEPEPFSIHFKVDAKPLESLNTGAAFVLNGIKEQSDNLRDTALGMIPFKEKFRKMHRDWRRKKM